MDIKKGSCLCGEVKFEIEGNFDSFYLCHCSLCRKDTGSAHAANLFSASAMIKWLSGKEKITTFNLPLTRHKKSFCSVCGSALPCLQMEGKLLVVPAGSLDSNLLQIPDAHINTSSRAPWDHDLEKVKMFNEYPDKT